LANLCPKNCENFRGDRIQEPIFSKKKYRPLAVLRKEASEEDYQKQACQI
jgi:hypothetical protein